MGTSLNPKVSRRTFLKWSAILGSSITLAGCSQNRGIKTAESLKEISEGNELIIPTSCIHNCGGRCLLKAHVKDGVIKYLTTDDTMPDTFDVPQVRA
ncbi:MAG: dimethyl sulfoxide reductase subunit A, partial [Moorella sp. (in: firmicutes)]